MQVPCCVPPQRPLPCSLPSKSPPPLTGADLAGQGKGGELAVVGAVLVQLAKVDLDAGMVLSCNQLVGPRAATMSSLLAPAFLPQRQSP